VVFDPGMNDGRFLRAAGSFQCSAGGTGQTIQQLGIASRFADPDPWEIVAVGMLLWIGGVSIFWYFYRTQQGTKYGNLSTSVLVWRLQFVAVYAATSLATNAFLHR